MKLKSFVVGSSLCLAAAMPSTVAAAPMGLLNLSSGGAGVQVSATTINWVPLNVDTGTMITDAFTDVDYTGGSLGGGVTGTIKDLPPVPSAGFMTFTGHPLVFDLAGVGPGNATDCGNPVGGFVASGSCSFTAFGSPFILTVIDADTTAVALGAFGQVTDGDGFSTWDGSFTTQVQLSIAEIFDAIYGAGPGYINSGYSGEFDVEIIPVPVPEPASMVLLGLGFAAAGLGFRRRRS